jgi:hypothetical protein
MPGNFTLHILMPLSLGAISLAFIALGLYALIRRRPFIIHAGWMLASVIVAMSPSVFLQLSMFFGEDRYRSASLGLISLLGPLTTVIIVCFVALQMRGYLVFGTTQESFRDAVISALSTLNLKYEETLSSIRLPSVPAELQVAVQGWIGTGQLRLRNGGRPGLLADVAAGMNGYFNSAKAKTNMTSAVVYLVLGILMSAMVVTLLIAVR